MTPAAPTPRKTPLTEWHRAHGARLADAAGWELPVHYSGSEAEVTSVKEAAGLFDASHLGEIELAGADAGTVLTEFAGEEGAALVVSDVRALTLTHDGGAHRILVCRLGKTHFLLITSPSATDRLFGALRDRAAAVKDLAAVNTSSRYALLWLQGPASNDVLQGLTSADVDGLPCGSFTYGEVAGVRTTMARVSVGEDEALVLLVPPQSAERVWDAVLREGDDLGVRPVGTAAMEQICHEAGARLPILAG